MAASALRVAGTCLRVAALNEAQYRVNFYVQLVQSAIAVTTALVVQALVFGHTTDLGGWTRDQLLVVLGTHVIMGGVVQTAIQPSMNQIIDDVHRGTLDFVLTKPVDSQLLSSVRQVRLWHLADLAVGAVLVAIGAQRNGGASLSQSLLYVALLALGVVLIYCVWLSVTVASFWVVRMDYVVNDLFDGLFQAGRWPVTIYPGWLRATFTVLVPLAFAVTVPAQALTGRLTPGTVAVAVAFAVLAVAGSRRLWTIGVRHYAGASA